MPSSGRVSGGGRASVQRQNMMAQSPHVRSSPNFTASAPHVQHQNFSSRPDLSSRSVRSLPTQRRSLASSSVERNLASRGRMTNAQALRDRTISPQAQDLSRDRQIVQANRRNLTSRQSAAIASSGSRSFDRSTRGRTAVRNYGTRSSSDLLDRTWRERRGDHHRRWDGSADWYPDRDWAWHHHHRFFWGGVWVIGDYPAYGYAPTDYVIDNSVPYAASSTAVDVQEALAEEGYYNGPIDGVIGSETRDAIASYQSDNGLAVSGLIDEELMSSLGVI